METHERPDTVGPYTILDVLGEGGMGIVYLAEQHEPVRRTVALKVLKPEEGSKQVLARFQAERQALAVMDHPAIAKIFDAGVTPDGDSYFAMERVEGPSLTRFCDDRRVTVAHRVRLFVEVCRAVQHAHQKGMIHRDLKPSNVLVSEVDGRPLPRIIDFGIAKAVEPEEFDGARLTRADQIIGTPAYMSPEQIEGSADIDTRSDIYSLGVLLFELLAGVLPYDPEAYRGWAAVAAAHFREPGVPSRRFSELGSSQETVAGQRQTSVPGLRKELHGDLDFIVSKAMEKDRADRYETANGLAMDLERYLANQPVRAVGAGTAYVLRKFVRRHRLAVGFVATAIVALVAFSVITAVQANRIAKARDRADARAQQAEGLIDFVLTDLRQKLEPVGRLDVLEDVGAAATEYFASLPEEEFTVPELLSRSQNLYQIGENEVNGGDLQTAQLAFSESLRLAEELSRRAPEDTERLFALGQSYFWAGYVPYLEGDYDLALKSFGGYLQVSERLVLLDPENLEFRLELGYAGANIGSVREANGDLPGAAEAFGATLAIAEELAQRDPENIDRQLDVANNLNALAVVFRKMGRLDEARSRHEAELQIKRNLVSMDPGNVPLSRALGLGYQYMGEVQTLVGDEGGALSSFRSSFALHLELLAVDSANAEWQRGLAINRRLLGETLSRGGEPEAAQDQLGESNRLLEDLVFRDPGNIDWQRELAASRTSLAGHLAQTGDPAAALAQARLGLRALEPFLAAASVDLETRFEEARAHLVLGRIQAAMTDAKEAVRSWERALDAVRSVSEDLRVVEFTDLEVRALTLLGRKEEAQESLDALYSMGYLHPGLTQTVGTS